MLRINSREGEREIGADNDPCFTKGQLSFVTYSGKIFKPVFLVFAQKKRSL